MDRKTYYRVTASAFTLIAVMHAARSLYGWEAEINGVMIPLWISYASMGIAAYLAYRGFTAKVR